MMTTATSFNPCFNGCRSAILNIMPAIVHKGPCFNPCFNGCRSAITYRSRKDFIRTKFQSLF